MQTGKWTESQGSAEAVQAAKEKYLGTQTAVGRDLFLIPVAWPLRPWVDDRKGQRERLWEHSGDADVTWVTW